MKYFKNILLFILPCVGVFLSAILIISPNAVAEDDRVRTACEQEAYKYFPDPNFNPQTTGRSTVGGPGGVDFTQSVPSASDYDKAKQKREKYIEECEAGKK